MAEIVYIMITEQREFEELGEDFYNNKKADNFLRYMKRKAKSLGYELVEKPKENEEKTA